MRIGYALITPLALGLLQPKPIAQEKEGKNLHSQISPFACLDFNHDGRLLAFGDSDGSIKVLNLQTGKKTEFRIPGSREDCRLKSLAFSNDGCMLATGSLGRIDLWETSTGKHRSSWKASHQFVNSLWFLRDGKTIVSFAPFDAIKGWNVVTGQEKVALCEELAPISAAVCPETGLIASGHNDGKARLWDPLTKREVFVLDNKIRAGIGKVAFSSDAKELMCVGHDRVVRLWRIPECTSAEAFQAFDYDGRGPVVYSPDGGMVAIACSDQRIRISNAATQHQVAVLRHKGNILALVFSPDGSVLASCSSDGMIEYWEIRKTAKGR